MSDLDLFAHAQAGEVPDRPDAFTVYKDDDGIRHMVIVSSNGYKDRESEYVSAESLQSYVDSQWQGSEWAGDNVLLFWHDGPAIGEIVHADMEGPFLFEVARERDSGLPLVKAYTRAIWDYIENHPEEKWGASIGFGYKPDDKELTDDGPVYHKIRKYETSILPVEYAANAYTVSGVIQMTQARDEKLNGIMPGWGDKLRTILGLEKGKLDEAGIEHKALGPQITQQDLVDTVVMAVKMVAIKDNEGEEVSLKDVVQGVVDELMDIPTVSVEAAEQILAVEDVDNADTAEPDAEPVEEAADHDHTEPEPNELEKALSGVVSLNEQLIEEQKAFAEQLPALIGALEALADIPAELAEVKATVADMQANFKQRPRASVAAETLASEEVVKEVIADDSEVTLFGRIPVKE